MPASPGSKPDRKTVTTSGPIALRGVAAKALQSLNEILAELGEAGPARKPPAAAKPRPAALPHPPGPPASKAAAPVSGTPAVFKHEVWHVEPQEAAAAPPPAPEPTRKPAPEPAPKEVVHPEPVTAQSAPHVEPEPARAAPVVLHPPSDEGGRLRLIAVLAVLAVVVGIGAVTMAHIFSLPLSLPLAAAPSPAQPAADAKLAEVTVKQPASAPSHGAATPASDAPERTQAVSP